MASFFSSSSSPLLQPLSVYHYFTPKFKLQKLSTSLTVSATSSQNDSSDNSTLKSTKLVTFLGKGGSGKTTSSVFAAQHYAAAGLRTCLVIQTQDPTADYLLNSKIGNSPVLCNDNLSAVRLETTKMLLEPLSLLKQADAGLNITQGVLGGIVEEELGVLPAMDSIFAAFALERLAGLLEIVVQNSSGKDKFDIIIYDGVGTDETLRMIGAASNARLYLRCLRKLAEKTDLGRLAGPSILRLVDEAMSLSGRSSPLNGKMSAEIWEALEKMLERGSSAFNDPCKFGCFLVMDPNNKTSVDSALRYWGCTIQAGSEVSGAIGISHPHLTAETMEEVKNKFSPLPFALLPHISMSSAIDWNSTLLRAVSQDTRILLSSPASSSEHITPPIRFDTAKRSITLFLPGFDKSEIKLYQHRGGSELLVEAGDQRRIINLPQKIQGKVGGAKFVERSLIITLK